MLSNLICSNLITVLGTGPIACLPPSSAFTLHSSLPVLPCLLRGNFLLFPFSWSRAQDSNSSRCCTLTFRLPSVLPTKLLHLPGALSPFVRTVYTTQNSLSLFPLDGTALIVMTKPFANEIPEILSTIQSALCFCASVPLQAHFAIR